MIRLYRIFHFNTRLLAYLTLLLVAVYVIGARIALSLLPDYRDDLEIYLSEQLDIPVRIESLTGTWIGFDPVVAIEGVSINGKEHVNIGRITLRAAFLRTLLAKSPRLRSVWIEDSHLALRHYASGAWEIAGIPIETGESDAGMPDLTFLSLFEGADIALNDLMLEVTDRRQRLRHWRLPSVALSYGSDEVFASGQVLQPEGLQPLFAFSLNGQGVSQPEPIHGSVYLEARSSEFIDELIKVYEWEKISLQDVDANGRLWLDFEGMAIRQLQGNLQVRELNWTVEKKSLPPLANLATEFQWLPDNSSGAFYLNNLSFDWMDQRCAPADVAVRYVQSSGASGEQVEDKVQPDSMPESASSEAVAAQESEQATMNGEQAPLAADTDSPIEQGKKPAAGKRQKLAGHSRSANTKLDTATGDSNGKVLEQNAESAVEIYLDTFDMACAADIAVALEVGSRRLQSRLETSQPRGLLKNVHIDLGAAANNDSGFRMEAELRDIHIDAYESTPSGKGLDGLVRAEGAIGSVTFQSDGFELGFPKLFLQPFVTRKAEGLVSWRVDGEDIDIYSQGLRLFMPNDSLVYGDFLLRLNDQHHEDYLGLMIAVQDVPFIQATDLVPFHEVGEELHDWLSASLKDGVVKEGIYVGYGAVEETNPGYSFTNSIYLKTEAGELKFDEQWPPLQQLDADIVIQDDDLVITASRASIQGQSLNNLHAHMPSVPEGEEQILRATADTSVNREQQEYWLKASPISDQTEDIAEQFDISGDLAVNLDIRVPMSSGRDVGYDVAVAFSENTVTHLPTTLSLDKVQGALRISSDEGLVSEAIDGTLFDHPTHISITSQLSVPDSVSESSDLESEGDAPARPEKQWLSSKVLFQGKTDFSSIFQHYLEREPLSLAGGFEYSAMLELPIASEADARFSLTSDLIGMERNWPVPLSKSFAEAEKLDVEVLIKPASLFVNADLDTVAGVPLKSELLFVDESLSFGQILLGEAKPPEGLPAGLGIWAAVADIELDPWIDFVEHLAKGTEGETELLKSVHVSANSVLAYGQTFRNADARIYRSGGVWIADLKGPDIQGQINLGNAQQTMDLNLDRLVVKTGDASTDTAEADGSDVFDPSTLPALTASVSELLVDDLALGAWSTRFEPNESGIIFRNIRGRLADTEINGQLNWQYVNDQSNSILTLDAKGGDFDKLMQTFGWPSVMSSNQYTGNVALVWTDSPEQFEMAKLSGKIALDLEEGFLKTSDQKTGALRLFGIFNADALSRRLRLDFSDLYKSGIGYDATKLRASIDQGNLTLDEALTIKGPSSSYEIKGGADLGARSLDMSMRVELPISNNVPLAALLLGAPQIGGAVWLIDKLLGQPLSKITTASYTIKGTFDDPILELKQVLNAK